MLSRMARAMVAVFTLSVFTGDVTALAQETSPTLEPSPIDLLFPKERIKRVSVTLEAERWLPQAEAWSTIYPEAAWRPSIGVGAFIGRQFNPSISSGLIYVRGQAVGSVTGTPSEDQTTMLIVPVEASLLYRFDYSWDQIVQPFIGVGADAYPWREVAPSTITSGIKWGVHGTGGILMRLNFMETSSGWAPLTGVTPVDAGLTLAGSYAWVNSFGRDGLDLSGIRITLGGYLAF